MTREFDPRTRQDMIDKATRLRSEGKTWAEVSRAIGVHWVTAYRWLNPEARIEHLRQMRVRRLSGGVDSERWLTRPPYYEFLRKARELARKKLP